MVKLYCAVDGVTGSAFPVDIDASQSVGDLKEAIKNNPSTIKYKLQLYLAKKGHAWITNNEAEGMSDVAELPHLRFPQTKLRCVGLSDDKMVEVDEDEEAAGNGPVNVLVWFHPKMWLFRLLYRLVLKWICVRVTISSHSWKRNDQQGGNCVKASHFGTRKFRVPPGWARAND
jgi:hypothetical protein